MEGGAPDRGKSSGLTAYQPRTTVRPCPSIYEYTSPFPVTSPIIFCTNRPTAMSRNRFSFRSTPSTQQVPTTSVVQTPEQKKDAANSEYWDAVYGEDWTNGKGKDVERLWGIENFGNTCYCNSVLQALYACQPFRAFVEAYPNTPPPVSALGPPPGEANVPNSPSAPNSPLPLKKESTNCY